MFNRFLNVATATLIAILFAGCIDKDTDENDDTVDLPDAELSYLSGSIVIDGVPVIDGEYTVSDYYSTASTDEGNFDMETVTWDGLPQIIMVENKGGDIVMLSKSFDTYQTIDEESTAFALATLNPLFGKLKAEEYYEVMNRLQSTSSYPEYYDEVRKSIAAGRDIFDTSNTALAKALHDVITELFTAKNDIKQQSRAIDGIVDDFSTDPIRVRNEGATVVLDIPGLNPSYEVSVIHDAKDYGEPQLIKTHGSYGVMDLIFPPNWSGLKYGEPTHIRLNGDGRYEFFCTCTSPWARMDLRFHLMADVCSMFGLISGFLDDSILGLAVDIESVLLGNYDSDLNGFIPGLMDAFSKFALDQGIKTMGDAVKVFGKSFKLDKLKKIANGTSAFLNIVGIENGLIRTAFAFLAQQDIKFNLCVQSETIQKCENPDIYILSGNKQTGNPGEMLPIDLKVGVKATMGSKVRFEVVSGGGSVNVEYANIRPSEDVEGTFYATTKWTLGSEGRQIVDAYITNQDGTKASLSVQFHASLNEDGDYLLSVGDVVNFRYDSEGRPKRVSVNAFDESEIATFSYNPMIIKSVTSDDNLSYTATWSDFKFSDDGKRITGFKWVEDGEKGNVTVRYDFENRITSIIDNSTEGIARTSFTWDGMGRLEKVRVIDGEEELSIIYSYGSVAGKALMYPFSMCLDMPWFFMTGLFGEGPAILPTMRSDLDANDPEFDTSFVLDYLTNESTGKITFEKITVAGYNLAMDYRYGSIDGGSRSTNGEIAAFPGFKKKTQKMRRLGHARR